jgi:hypothetical protein
MSARTAGITLGRDFPGKASLEEMTPLLRTPLWIGDSRCIESSHHGSILYAAPDVMHYADIFRFYLF